MISVYSTGNPVQRIPRPWTTMTGSALLHAAVIGGIVTLAGVSATVVAPRPEMDLTFVEVVPPPARVPLRMPPVVREEIRYVEIAKDEPKPEPPPVPEEIVARTEPTPPAPEPPREKAIEPPKPAPRPVTLGSFDPTGNSVRAPEAARAVVQAGFDATAA